MTGAFSRHDMVTPGGVRLATLRWPGSGPPLYLMHATGFCAATIAVDQTQIHAVFRELLRCRQTKATRSAEDQRPGVVAKFRRLCCQKLPPRCT